MFVCRHPTQKPADPKGFIAMLLKIFFPPKKSNRNPNSTAYYVWLEKNESLKKKYKHLWWKFHESIKYFFSRPTNQQKLGSGGGKLTFF